MSKRFRSLLILTGFLIFLFPIVAYCQDILLPDSTTRKEGFPEKKSDFNEFNLGFTTFRLGMACILDYAHYSQDQAAKDQMDSANVEIKDQWKWRDFRFFWSGRLKTKRPVTWKVGIMYDVVDTVWTFRETGLLIGLPELSGNVFLGRSKEGYSLNKVQNGYSCWANERQPSLDLIPIMTDGIRFYGYFPKPRILYSAGAFTNLFYGNDNKFALWEWQFSGRFGYRPIYDEAKKKLVHLGVSFRYAKPDQNEIQVKSRPESNPAPYFINTGTFESAISTGIGIEAYYRNKALMVGTEANVYHFASDEAGDPNYVGASVFGSYMLTGEAWPYLSENSVFFFVDPKKSIFHGGPGAIELLLLCDFYNTNSGSLPGGNFWKITPMVNWYLSYNFRVELVYGYGMLDRFQLDGATQFFQTRFQFQLL